MNIKNLIFFIIFGLSVILGVYLLLITGSYFLLIFSSFFGILFGYFFGNLARQSKELKKVNSNPRTDT